MKILVVEDERVTRTRIVSYLKEWGHHVVEASDGSSAWTVFQDYHFDMVITDWLMPGMDGTELLKKIRGSELVSYLYAILLTSRSEKSDVVAGMESGADDFICKPFDKDELRVRVQAAQRIVELEAALAEKNKHLAEANEVLRAANTRMKESLLAAAKIQRSFLPERVPDSPGAEFAWVYEPCDELGGDTLNVVPLDDSHVGIYICDVSGHGVPAALLSVHLSRFMTRLDGARSVLRKKNGGGEYEVTSPTDVAAELNRHFVFNNSSTQYFTATYGVLDLEKREFRFTSAGHPGPLVISGGKGSLYKARPPAVGFLPDAEFQEETVSCKAGDRLYFYTDGIFEVADRNGEEFGQQRLCDVLANAADQPLDESLRCIVRAVKAWAEGEPFADDVSLIGVEVR